jgi:hypothetical protein
MINQLFKPESINRYIKNWENHIPKKSILIVPVISDEEFRIIFIKKLNRIDEKEIKKRDKRMV